MVLSGTIITLGLYSPYAMHWRTHVVDVATPSIDGEIAYELCDTAVSSTEAAIQNSHPLLDWEEYRSV